MYDHNKGKPDAPRHDLYLIGSIHNKRFRSIPEYVPHAMWLMTDPTLDRANCECKYCAKVPQRIISENLGFKSARLTPSTPMATPSRRPPRPPRDVRPRPPREPPKPYAAVRRAPRPAKQVTGPKQAMVHERFSDLQSIYSDLDTVEIRKWFREGELVWCALEPPIRGRDEQITFWPGLVQESQVKSEAIPRAQSVSTHSADGDYEMENGTEMAHVDLPSPTPGSSHLATPHPAEDQPVDDNAPSPWVIRQKTIYKVKLLAVAHDYLVRDDQVLPYQGYAPSQALLEAMQNVPIEKIPFRTEEVSTFNPCPSDADDDMDDALREKRFAEATAPYSLAVEIAAGIATYWTPTDEWEYKMTAPPPPPAARSTTTLHDAITAAHQGISSASNGLEGITAARTDMTTEELLSLKTRMLGPSPITPTFTQTRYQGLWLGAERIWTDELVRLKAARRQIAPHGAPNIYPPSGPSKATIQELGQPEDSEMLSALGAMDRGVFMKLEALFVVDVPDDQGKMHRECRASGMLYELADEGWEDPEETKAENLTNGKGKEKENGTSTDRPTSQDALSAAGLANPRFATPDTARPVELQRGEPFMSTPSPMRPHPLPNPDPTVPIADTVPAMLAATDPAPPAPGGEANVQLSRPKMQAFPLPPAPHGFRFRPILPPGNEVVITLTLISGRYYPRLLAHPLLRPVVRGLEAGARDHSSVENQHLLALEGIFPGFFNAVDATKWKPTRLQMVKDADAERTLRMVEVWEKRRKDAQLDTDMFEGAGAAGAGPSNSQVAMAS
ncbi:hypothetical protein BV25DRAFT_1827254 [Artomyces pyxidatus]|uniref:Uncharacterized protein n=1 Tax=Artomyces pyxidatus TaxID=48021 RepID=A0ACB8SZ67_9AGAM|nr:hypothetical protein BV25DRAFT_1827254 [Artomyces pyxidatus]